MLKLDAIGIHGKILYRNTIANLGTSTVIAALNIASIPILFNEFGPRNYTIVGLYYLVIQWAIFLDLGVAPAFGRFVAKEYGSESGYARIRYLLHWQEKYLFLIFTSLFLIGIVFKASTFLEISLPESFGFLESTDIFLLFLIVMARVGSNYYRIGLMSLELQTKASILTVSHGLVRIGVPLILAMLIDLKVQEFVLFLLVIGFIEACIMRAVLLGNIGQDRETINKKSLLESCRFGGLIAGLGLMWTICSQIDKYVISTLLSAESFGYFMFSIQMASIILFIGAPIQTALQPRLVRIYSSKIGGGEIRTFISLYQIACIINVALGYAGAVTVYLGGETLLKLLSIEGSQSIDITLIAAFYCAGNAFINIMALMYSLQYASGSLRLHCIGSLILTPVQLITVWLAATLGGVQLVALSFAILNVSYILVWGHFVHAKYSCNHFKWILTVFLKPTCISIFALLVGLFFGKLITNEWAAFGYAALFGLVVMLSVLLSNNAIVALFKKPVSENA